MMSRRGSMSCWRSAPTSPEMTPADGLSVGEVGYLITGVKDVRPVQGR
ncbi:Elongation factor 4 OS=Streptomyces antimycoticus OX=68175 GN=lepA PE=3 SV=1 [Streptomyces antimycoticus]